MGGQVGRTLLGGGGGGNLQTDATQLFLFVPIPAKAKKLGLLSIYKFSLAIPHYDLSVGAKESKTTRRFSYIPWHVQLILELTDERSLLLFNIHSSSSLLRTMTQPVIFLFWMISPCTVREFSVLLAPYSKTTNDMKRFDQDHLHPLLEHLGRKSNSGRLRHRRPN